MDLYLIGGVNQAGNFKLTGKLPNLLCLATWDKVNPSAGVFDWTAVQAAQAAAKAWGGSWSLGITAGVYTPAWVGCQRFTSVSGEVVPIPWDTTFLTAWEALCQAAATEFGSDPALDHVDLMGINLKTPATALPAAAGDIANWAAALYSITQVGFAWSTIGNMLADLFPAFVGAPEPAGFPLVPNQGSSRAQGAILTAAAVAWKGYIFEADDLTATFLDPRLPAAQKQYWMAIGLQTAKPLGTGINAAIALATVAEARFLEVYGEDGDEIT